VLGAKHRQGGPLPRICNAAIGFERPAETEDWAVTDYISVKKTTNLLIIIICRADFSSYREVFPYLQKGDHRP
jgi:hypothetical protein